MGEHKLPYLLTVVDNKQGLKISRLPMNSQEIADVRIEVRVL